jgi:amidase/6-aminohexanoate-cyclic-dimer hydrolase
MTAFKEYDRYDALGLAELIASKQVSASEVLETAIARIEALNPSLNAVVHKMYDEARRSIRAGLPQGPFTGVPFLLKDLGAWYKGAPVGGGSHLYDGFIADRDFTIVERYKAAGLVILGRTNTPELGLVPTTEPRAYGPTRNPWNREHSAGGSSGGAAAAVAARMLPAAHATDGGGSIRIPAANCGLVGLKPTRARTPAGPLVGEGWGGMAIGHAVTLSLRDSAALLDATAGPAPGDPYCAPAPARPFLQEVGADPGRLRIAITTTSPWGNPLHSECIAAVTGTATLCEELGHRVVEAMPSVDTTTLRWARDVIVSGSVANSIDNRLEALGRPLRNGEIETLTALWAERGRRYTARDVARATAILHGIGRRFAAFFADYDVLISPVLSEPPPRLGVIDTMTQDFDGLIEKLLRLVCFTRQFNVSGGPAMSLPLHWTPDGLPIGVQLAADFGNEAVLFRLGTQLETARPWRDKRPPL